VNKTISLFGAAMLVVQFTAGFAWGMSPAQPWALDTPVRKTQIDTTLHINAPRPATEASAPGKLKALPAARDEVLSSMPPSDLSPQEQQIDQIAQNRGDQTYLMVDKTLGKIILFMDGKPVFTGAALTGESAADQFPPDELSKKFSRLNAPEYKVTPAGRYTVSRGYDEAYGPLLDINEIHGKDWGIAIHKVYVGTPSEHRESRLRSTNNADKRITFGCINVEPATIRRLLHELPTNKATPLYILPWNEEHTAVYFPPRFARGDSFARLGSSSGPD
jgi:hypothetical protein